MGANARFATALHVLAVLAHQDGDPVSSEFLSASVNTNPVVIRRLLRALQTSRLVETRKGPRAGSRLARSAARVRLADVYQAVRDPALFGLPRRRPSPACPVGQRIHAVLKPLFASAELALSRDLARTTLADVLRQIQRLR